MAQAISTPTGSLERAVERVLSNALSNNAITLVHVQPGALRQGAAGKYIGFSDEWTRRTRFADIQRLRETEAQVDAASKVMAARVDAGEIHAEDAARELGIEFEPIQGPRWFRVGQTVLYSRADLDAWIAGRRRRA